MRTLAMCGALLVASSLMAQATLLPQDQPSPTVRGVTFGSSEATLSAMLKLAKGACSGKPPTRSCSAKGAIGPVATDDFYHLDELGGMSYVGMSFPTQGYPALRDAFTLKYGAPSSAKSATYKNNLGASYEFETDLWIGQSMVISLEQYSREMSFGGMSGYVWFMTRAQYDKNLAEFEAKRKKAAADF
jgi:hypothetical protein